MSSIDWSPELATALDELVPLEESSRADWNDVLARAGSRRARRLGRARPRRSLRLAIVIALLLLLLAGMATATYLLLHGNGKIAVAGRFGQLLAVNPNGPGLRVIARCTSETPSCTIAQPAWSPDGNRVAFVRGTYGLSFDTNHMFVYVAAADGRGAKRLAPCSTCGEQYGSQLVWSPHGKRIAFTGDAGTKDGYQSLSVVAAGGGRPHRIDDCRGLCWDFQPAWSPNGRLLAFVRWTRTPRRSGLFTIRPDGTGLRRIVARIAPCCSGNPEWSPDGRRIVFDGSDGTSVVNADGSHVRVLFAGTGGTGPGAASWSPDGRKIVFFKTPGRRGHYRAEVWTMNPDGSDKKRLYHSGCCVGLWAPPVWSPDGHKIAFSANSAGGTFVMNTDGSGLRRLSRDSYYGLSWQGIPRH